MANELRPEHFDEDAIADIQFAGSALIAVVEDINHHHNYDGAWQCIGTNPADEVAYLRGVLDQAEEGIKEARRRLAEVERPARLKAAREARRKGGQS